jgi:D-3-phosphoglycerate dehydrogenase
MTKPRVLISDKPCPRRRPDLQGSRHRGRLPAGPRQGQGQARSPSSATMTASRSARQHQGDAEKVLAARRTCKVIGRAGIGVDNVDIPAATAKGIIVMNTPFGNSITTAEHAIAMMFALARQIPDAECLDPGRQVGEEPLHGRRADGQDARHHRLRQYRLDRRRPRLGLKMKVIAFDPFLSPERASGLGVEKVELDELLPPRRLHHAAHAADGADQEHHLPRGAREDEEGRAHHQLRPRRAGGRGRSARRPRSPATWPARLRRLLRPSRQPRTRCSACPNVICTPHLGASTTEAQENVALQVAEQMADYLLSRARSPTH